MVSEHFMNEVFSYFERKLRTEETRRNYRLAVKGICNYCGKDFFDLTPTDAAAYMEAMKTGKVLTHRQTFFTRETINVRFSCLHSLAADLEDSVSGSLPIPACYVSPFKSLEIGDTPDIPLRMIPSTEEIDRILANASSLTQRVIILLAVRCGLTTAEIIDLKPADFVQDEKGTLYISIENPRTGGRKIKVPADLLPDVCMLLDCTGPSAEYLFLTDCRLQPYSKKTLASMVKKCVAKARCSHDWTLKDLRNACSAYMLYSGAEDGEVADFLGILPKWICRFKKAVGEMDVQPNELSVLQVKAREPREPQKP